MNFLLIAGVDQEASGAAGGTPTQPTPTFSPVAGSYSGTQSVTITSASADNIYYTTDGSTPTTGSTPYTGAISVSASETVKALAVRSGYTDSAIGSAAYTISAAVTLIANVASQQPSGFTQPSGSTAINTTGANFIVAGINGYDNQWGANVRAVVADGFGAAPTVFTGNGGDSYGGGSLTINGTFTGGAGNAFAGKQFAVAGYSTQVQNNGYWMCTASSNTSITLTVPGGVAQGSTGGVYCAESVNVWKPIPQSGRINDFGGGVFWYTVGVPTVGANHYFITDDRSVSGAGDGSSFAIAAFSGVKTSSDPYVQNVYGSQISSGTSVPGASITPTVNNLLVSIVTGLILTGPESIDSGFTVTDSYVTASGLENPIGMAYLVPGSASPLTPTWTVGHVGNRAYSQTVEFAHS